MPEAAARTLARMRSSIGIGGVAEALLYPLLTPLFTVPAWLRSLWAARILLDGQWHRYRGYTPLNALTSFFYKSQWLNVSRFGIHGRSPLVGLGDYPLSRWFHLTLLSSCLYANAGAVCTLAGTLAWVFVHLVWLDAIAAPWVLAVVAVLFFSSTAFAMAFTRQNYNILGWLWLPLALQAVLSGHWVLAACAFLAASLASITVIFAALPLMFVLALISGAPEPLVVLLPALLKLALHLEPMLSTGGVLPALRNMAKVVGLSSAGVRYRRTSMRLRPFSAYFIAVYATGCAVLWVDHGLPVLPLAAFVLFVVNQLLARFADEQSVILMFVSVVAAHVLLAPPSWMGLVALSLVANPLPVFLGLCSFEHDRTLVRAQARAPFDHTPLQGGFETFFAPVPAGSTVLFAFDDPGDVYENLFDGYRSLLDLPLFVAASRGVRLFPDWHAIAETNFPGSPTWWGRSPDAVRANAARLGASWVIVYADSGAVLDPVWSRAGFVETANIDWAAWSSLLEGAAPWRSGQPPRWWLLAAPVDAAVGGETR